ncbi:MAG TPA: hypothetical protein VGF50_14265 [Caulobacteraceae bacterium]|jgi:hypothetical protein
MADEKLVGRLKLMLGHAQRALEQEAPDLRIVEKLLGDALSLAVELNEPANPYSNRALRPGLSVSEADPAGDGVALTTAPHPQEKTDV